MAAIGPLLVPGRSKWAKTSSARFFSVRRSVMTSLSAVGTPPLRQSMSLRPLVRRRPPSQASQDAVQCVVERPTPIPVARDTARPVP